MFDTAINQNKKKGSVTVPFKQLYNECSFVNDNDYSFVRMWFYLCKVEDHLIKHYDFLVMCKVKDHGYMFSDTF